METWEIAERLHYPCSRWLIDFLEVVHAIELCGFYLSFWCHVGILGVVCSLHQTCEFECEFGLRVVVIWMETCDNDGLTSPYSWQKVKCLCWRFTGFFLGTYACYSVMIRFYIQECCCCVGISWDSSLLCYDCEFRLICLFVCFCKLKILSLVGLYAGCGWENYGSYSTAVVRLPVPWMCRPLDAIKSGPKQTFCAVWWHDIRKRKVHKW